MEGCDGRILNQRGRLWGRLGCELAGAKLPQMKLQALNCQDEAKTELSWVKKSFFKVFWYFVSKLKN